jgi:hypothetical protein
MQAGFLIRQTQGFVIELNGLKDWTSANMTREGIFVSLLDLRKEPMYRAMEMTRSSFREEVIGRLIALRNRHKKDERKIPLSIEIDSAVSVIEGQGSPICWALPGPLEGHQRPTEKGVNLPQESVKNFSEDIFCDQTEKFLSVLTYLSQFYCLGDEILAKVREVISRASFKEGFTGFPGTLMRIIDASFIACAHRDVNLSREIGAKIVAASNWANSEYNPGIILKALLTAGAAFQNDSEWTMWLEEQLAEVSFRLPAGELSKEFLICLKDLKKTLNLKLRIHSRPEAITSAGF